MLRRPSVMGILKQDTEMSLKFRWYFEVLGRGGGKGTYVNEQPNIEDLICAGMSSGPAKGNLGIIGWSYNVDYGFCMSNSNKIQPYHINGIHEQMLKYLLLLSWFNNSIQYTRLEQAKLHFILMKCCNSLKVKSICINVPSNETKPSIILKVKKD
jgi:hypothetical protein